MPKAMRTVWLVLAAFWVLLLGGEPPRTTELLMVGCGLASAVCGLFVWRSTSGLGSERPGRGTG